MYNRKILFGLVASISLAFLVGAFVLQGGNVVNNIKVVNSNVGAVYQIQLSSNGKVLYVSDGNSGNLAGINTNNYSLLPNIATGASNGQYLSASGGNIFYDSQSNFNLYMINQTTNKVSTINFRPYGAEPSLLASYTKKHLLYVGSGNTGQIFIVNTSNDIISQIINLPSGSSQPQCLVISPNGNVLYVCGGSTDNIVYEFNTSTLNPIVNFTIPETLLFGATISPDGKTFYVSGIRNGNVFEVNTLNNSVSQGFNTGAPNAWQLDLSPNGNYLYVNTCYDGNVYMLNTTTNTKLPSINLSKSSSLCSMQVSNITGNLYEGDNYNGNVFVINFNEPNMTTISTSTSISTTIPTTTISSTTTSIIPTTTICHKKHC